MEELLKEVQQIKKAILNTNKEKDPYELLTIEQVKKETKFGIGTVQKMFKDPKFNAQRYTTPFKVTRKALNEYISENHDYLSER